MLKYLEANLFWQEDREHRQTGTVSHAHARFKLGLDLFTGQHESVLTGIRMIVVPDSCQLETKSLVQGSRPFVRAEHL